MRGFFCLFVFFLFSADRNILSQIQAEEYSGAVLGKKTLGKILIFSNGFCTCECFDNCRNPPPLTPSVWWWSLWTTSSFCFHIFPHVSFACVWNGTHADLLRGPVTGNFKRKQWKPDATIYFLGERTHFCWKLETTAEKIVPSLKRGPAEIYGNREKGPAVIPGLHNNIPKKVERTGRRQNSTSVQSICVCVGDLCSMSPTNAIRRMNCFFNQYEDIWQYFKAITHNWASSSLIWWQGPTME